MLWVFDGEVAMARGASRNTLRALLSSLEERQIVHAYWKASRRLGESLQGEGDYDLLVLPEEREILRDILQERGFLRATPKPQNRHPQMEHWVGFCPDTPEQTAKLIHLHLHSAPLVKRRGLWEFSLGRAQDVLAAREFDPIWGVYRLSPAMELLLLLLRSFIEEGHRQGLRGPLDLRRAADLTYIWHRAEAKDIKGATSRLIGGEAGRQLGATLEQLKYRGLDPGSREATGCLKAQMDHIFREQLRILSPWQTQKKEVRQRAVALSDRARRALPKRLQGLKPQQKLRLPKGLFVAVVGVDGAGKTTLVEELHRWLGATLEVEKLYLGQGDFIAALWQFLAKLKRTLRSAPEKVGRHPEDQPQDRETLVDMEHPGYRRRLWELSRLAMAARLLREAKQARAQTKRGVLVLSDRFPSAKERYASGPAIAIRPEAGFIERQWAGLTAAVERRLLERAVQAWAPDLILRLSLEPEMAWERKSEHRLWDLQQKAAALERAEYGRAQVIAVDAAQPLRQVQAAAQRWIWRGLSSTSSLTPSAPRL